MEFVLLERALITLAIFKVLGALPVEHAIVPVPLVLPMTAFSVQHSPSRLHPVSELPLVPTAIRPPEGTFTVPLPALELALIHVALLPRPCVNTPSLLLVESELPYVVISCCKVEFAMAFELPVVEIPVYDFVSVFEEADALAVRPVDFGLPEVDNLLVLEEFGSVEGGFGSQHKGRTVLDNQKFLQLEFGVSQLPPNEGSLIVEVIKIKLRLLQHFLLAILINFEFAAHAADQNIEGFVHLLDGFEFAALDLL